MRFNLQALDSSLQPRGDPTAPRFLGFPDRGCVHGVLAVPFGEDRDGDGVIDKRGGSRRR